MDGFVPSGSISPIVAQTVISVGPYALRNRTSACPACRQLRRTRLARGHERPQRRQLRLGQPGEHRRRQRDGGDALPLHQREHLARRHEQFARRHAQRRTGQERGEDLGDRRIEAERRKLQDAADRLDVEGFDLGVDEMVKRAMRHRHAFRPSRGARRVDQIRERVGVRSVREVRGVAVRNRVDRDDDPRSAVRDRVLPPRRGRARLHRYVHRAGLHHAEDRGQARERRVHADGDAVLDADVLRAQPVRVHIRARVQLAIGQRDVGEGCGRGVRRLLDLLFEEAGDRGRRDGGRPAGGDAGAPLEELRALVRGDVIELGERTVEITGHRGEQCAQVPQHAQHRVAIEAAAVVADADLALRPHLHHHREREARALHEVVVRETERSSLHALHVQRRVLEDQQAVEQLRASGHHAPALHLAQRRVLVAPRLRLALLQPL